MEGVVSMGQKHMLQDLRVQINVDKQDRWRNDTALHHACFYMNPISSTIPVDQVLLQAGASPKITNKVGQKVLNSLFFQSPNHPAIIALRNQVRNAENASLLVKARRIGFISRNAVMPSYLQGRVLRGLP